MSNTMRTDEVNKYLRTRDEYAKTDNQIWVNHALQLEHELNAANERINRLEAVVNDPHALWANWLRGDVKLPAGIGDVRQYQDRIKRLEDAIEAYRTAYTPDGHVAPHDCFATGPKTGNPYQDLFACPGCWAELKAKEAKP